MFGFGKKKKEFTSFAIYSDEIDSGRISSLKKKLGFLGLPNKNPILGLGKEDSLELHTINVNGKDLNIFVIKTDDLDKESADIIEFELKRGLGENNTILLSIGRNDRFETLTFKGE